MTPGDPLGRCRLKHLLEDVAQLVQRRRILQQRGKLTVHHQRHQWHRGNLQRLCNLRGRVDVDLAQQEAALELLGQRLEIRGKP